MLRWYFLNDPFLIKCMIFFRYVLHVLCMPSEQQALINCWINCLCLHKLLYCNLWTHHYASDVSLLYACKHFKRASGNKCHTFLAKLRWKTHGFKVGFFLFFFGGILAKKQSNVILKKIQNNNLNILNWPQCLWKLRKNSQWFNGQCSSLCLCVKHVQYNVGCKTLNFHSWICM